MELTLPYPPSVNTYWRHPTTGKLAGRHLISEKGRAYRAAVEADVLQQRGNKRMESRLAISIDAFPPDRRQRDLDNLLKGLLDALTHSGVWLDDSQIDELTLIRREVVKGGKVKITVQEKS